jgi:hypothetical protein
LRTPFCSCSHGTVLLLVEGSSGENKNLLP